MAFVGVSWRTHWRPLAWTAWQSVFCVHTAWHASTPRSSTFSWARSDPSFGLQQRPIFLYPMVTVTVGLVAGSAVVVDVVVVVVVVVVAVVVVVVGACVDAPPPVVVPAVWVAGTFAPATSWLEKMMSATTSTRRPRCRTWTAQRSRHAVVGTTRAVAACAPSNAARQQAVAVKDRPGAMVGVGVLLLLLLYCC